MDITRTGTKKMKSVRTMRVLVTGNERVLGNKIMLYANRTGEGMRPCREWEKTLLSRNLTAQHC